MDENALEAMLARQRNAERGYQPQGSVRTEKTDEFEVYERKDAAADTGPAPSAPAARPAMPPSRAPVPPAPSRQAPLRPVAPPPGVHDFEELPGRQAAEAQPRMGPEQPQARPSRPGSPSYQPQVPPAPHQAEQAYQPPAPHHAEPPAYQPQAPPRTPADQAEASGYSQAPLQAEAPAYHGEAAHQEPLYEPEPAHPMDAPADSARPPTSTAEAPPANQAERAPTRRPQVWPPIQPRSHAPAPAAPQTASNGSGCRIAIVQATFNAEITDRMADAAADHARQAGAEVRTVKVPGVYDIPLAAHILARRKDVDAVVVIGCVIQGETDHDDLITFTTAKTLQEIALATETPIGLGIIGPGMTWEQAEARIGNGSHASEAAIAQWRMLQQV